MPQRPQVENHYDNWLIQKVFHDNYFGNQVQMILKLRATHIQIQILFTTPNTMRLFLCLLYLFIAVFQAQETIFQDLPDGQYENVTQRIKGIPQYFLCGASVWRRTEKLLEKQFCSFVPVLTRHQHYGCHHPTGVQDYKLKCEITPAVVLWRRINGISLELCHFGKWEVTSQSEKKGSWEKQEMKMCPDNMYVYGFKTKLTERDGMAGLILLCRSMRNPKESKQLLVLDGQGSWNEPVTSSNFAVGLKIKFRDEYINGISMQMAVVPSIIAFNMTYVFPQINMYQDEVGKSIHFNHEKTTKTEQVQINSQQQYYRFWHLYPYQLYPQFYPQFYITKMFSQSLAATTKIFVPTIQTIKRKNMLAKQEFTEIEREEKLQTFRLGIPERFVVAKKERLDINIPACSKCVIRHLVGRSIQSVRYEIQLKISNGMLQEQKRISGTFSGATTSQVKTQVRYVRIC